MPGGGPAMPCNIQQNRTDILESHRHHGRKGTRTRLRAGHASQASRMVCCGVYCGNCTGQITYMRVRVLITLWRAYSAVQTTCSQQNTPRQTTANLHANSEGPKRGREKKYLPPTLLHRSNRAM